MRLLAKGELSAKLTLEVGTLQSFLDEYLNSLPDARIDYIHGAEAVTRLGSQKGNIGFYLPGSDMANTLSTTPQMMEYFLFLIVRYI